MECIRKVAGWWHKLQEGALIVIKKIMYGLNQWGGSCKLQRVLHTLKHNSWASLMHFFMNG